MEKIIGCCSAIMAIVNIVLSTIWLIIMLKGKKGVKSKFVLPAVLCGIYIVECIMHIICQNTIGIFGMSINVFLWFFNFLIYFRIYREDRKELEEKEILAKCNKEGVMYVDFVEITK